MRESCHAQFLARRGATLLEVLLAVGILMAGMASLVAMFPAMLNGERDAEILTEAVALAQLKAEEIRRDDYSRHDLRLAIQDMTTSTTTPIAFPQEPRLTYSFSGKTLRYASILASDPTTTDTRAKSGIARVIIRCAPSYKASQDVIYELPFSD
jgi:type II secretory pathway pseudopilin PulG